ncbi:MAG: PQQ-binding-like beta-propeller repeat protein [bacterium]|nr:PQQ-binding-like beta-propeller repeat protein [bacterium]
MKQPIAAGTLLAAAVTLTLSNGRADIARPMQATADWPLYRGDTALTGIAQGTLTDELEVHWTFEAGGAIASSPVVSNGRVYVGSDDQNVYCLDFETGEKVWAFPTEDIVEAPPMVLGDKVYVGSSDYFFYALDAKTGELAWKKETDDKILGSASWVPGVGDAAPSVVVGSYDNSLYCFDAETGEQRWRYETGNYVNGTPAILDDRIVFGGCDAILHVVSAATGKAATQLELGQECHVAGSVGLDDGKAFFGHYGNAFVCVDLEGNKIVWEYTHPRQAFFSAPAILPDRVIFGGRDKAVHCVQKADGEELWKFPTRRKVDASPVVCGDKVVFGSGDGRLYVLSLETGELVWSYDVGRSIFSSPAVVAGRVLVGANDGKLYAFGAPRQNGDGK